MCILKKTFKRAQGVAPTTTKSARDAQQETFKEVKEQYICNSKGDPFWTLDSDGRSSEAPLVVLLFNKDRNDIEAFEVTAVSVDQHTKGDCWKTGPVLCFTLKEQDFVLFLSTNALLAKHMEGNRLFWGPWELYFFDPELLARKCMELLTKLKKGEGDSFDERQLRPKISDFTEDKPSSLRRMAGRGEFGKTYKPMPGLKTCYGTDANHEVLKTCTVRTYQCLPTMCFNIL
jgi:hypothetical protein